MREMERFDIVLEGINGPGTNKSIPCLEFGFGSSYTDLMLNNYLNNNGMNVTGGLEDIIPFTFVHQVDSATPGIQRGCRDGKVLKNAFFRYLTTAEGGEATVLTVVMEQVQIVNAKVKTVAANLGEATIPRAVEEVELVYEKIDWIEGMPGDSFLSFNIPLVFTGRYVGSRRK
jgi:type VI protein secretion system component Hcp